MKNAKLFILAIVIVIFLLINPGCKIKDDYDITGTWTITIHAVELDRTLSITFTGSKDSGTITLYDRNGNYTVSGDSVNFTISYWDREWGVVNETYKGQFDDENHMNGTASLEFVDDEKTETGTWEASR